MASWPGWNRATRRSCDDRFDAGAWSARQATTGKDVVVEGRSGAYKKTYVV